MKFKRVLLSTALMTILSTGAFAQNNTETYKNNIVKSDANTEECNIKFFTNFESGSLDSVSLKDMAYVSAQMQPGHEMYSFDVYSRFDPSNPADPKLQPSARWYFFLMTGVNNKEIILNMHNSDTRRPFYSYNGKDYMRFSTQECSIPNQIRKKYESDSVYIAYFTPYPESLLLSRIAEWSKRSCVEVSSIGTSEHGRVMPLLTITNREKENKDKKVVYIHGRIHTSETPGTWHLDQMIEIISGESKYASDLRDNILFYILPFTNPDGVQEGMSRSNAHGINLEVNYNSPDSVTAKEVKNILGFLKKIRAEKPVDLVLNMHSQSLDQVTYWVHSAESTSDEYYKNLLLLCNLTINDNPYFRKDDLKFSKHASRYVEGWFYDNTQGRTLAITFETPYTFYNNKPEGEWVSLENLRAQAINNVYAIGDYLEVPSTERIIVQEKGGKGFTKAKDKKHVYFGKSYLRAKKNGATAKYRVKELPAGKYDLYKWNAGATEKVSPDGINEWIKLGVHEQAENGKFTYTYFATGKGDVADNIMFVKRK
ncbi:MAG: hypothetical protein IKY70_03820 [Bacteroidales bacterium]|nr:hypothetical protein [Bacteroidales bacterium]